MKLGDLVEPSLRVTAQQTTYPIFVAQNLLKDHELLATFIANRPVFILTDEQVAPHYLECLKESCIKAQASQVDHYQVKAGEKSKSLSQAEEIWVYLLSKAYQRDLMVLTLGGGVIGDLGGFIASCFLRGVSLIHFPTTLLAQVDAAIGGKTAINTSWGKNLLGTYYQPHAVFMDLETLRTVENRDYICGIAELIKYGIVLKAPFFDWLEENIPEILKRNTTILKKAIVEACRLKANVVLVDERDQYGQRILLNFGHTLAHALENMLDYTHIRHGEAVAIGMIFALHLSVQYIGLNQNIVMRVEKLLKLAGLPTKLPPQLAIDEIWSKMKHDKKHIRTLSWVLVQSLGQAYICKDVTEDAFNNALSKLL